MCMNREPPPLLSYLEDGVGLHYTRMTLLGTQLCMQGAQDVWGVSGSSWRQWRGGLLFVDPLSGLLSGKCVSSTLSRPRV